MLKKIINVLIVPTGVSLGGILDKIILIFVGTTLLYCFLAQNKFYYYLFGTRVVWAQNNKVGIHILETVEVEKASELVNSSGGDWGYATIVLRDDDFDKEKWQKFMDDCRKLHLIPIVRIATHMENSFWSKPIVDDLNKWSAFLNSLNWPAKQQIVVLFNEPNHAKEWGGEISPSEYARIVDAMVNLFRSKNPDFFVMMAGFDQSADGKNETMKEEVFLQKMVEAVPDIFTELDGWVSHSYPSGFAGLPSKTGRASIKGYEWEIETIKKVAKVEEVEKVDNWDVYITETGWRHGKEEQKAEYMVKALEIWEKDEKVKAVTPFVLNYPAAPFEKFSWLKKDGSAKQNYEKVLGVSKIRGEPEQVESYEVVKLDLPEILPTNYEVKGRVRIKNTGQWIMGEREDFTLQVKEHRTKNLEPRVIISGGKLEKGNLIIPDEEVEMEFKVKTGTQSAEHHLKIGNKEYVLYVFKPFDLKNKKVSLWKQIVIKIRLWINRN